MTSSLKRPASTTRPTGRSRSLGIAVAWISVIFLTVSGMAPAVSDQEEPRQVADSLARMLQSARSVISRHQADINDETRADKGLTADVVLAKAAANYFEVTGVDPASYSDSSRHGQLLAAQIAAIREVMDDNQALINRKGIGFKGFIPATFARLVNEAFSRRVGEAANVKVTAPPELVRNRKARPDSWEVEVIRERFLRPDWIRGEPYAEVVEVDGAASFRMMVPEYYASSCLTCHGTPKGSLDITGYPREGASLHDLGGVISVTLRN